MNIRLLLSFLSIAFVAPVHAQITVTNTADSGAGSLRQAVIDAAGTDTIDFDASLSGQTITLTSGQISVNKDLTIDASSLPAGITIDGNGSSRIFQFNAGTSTLDSLTLINGNGNTGGGGAIYVSSSVELMVVRCTLWGNSANFGGGILNNDGFVTVQNSTLWDNVASDAGGGIFTFQGTLTVKNSTLTGNDATDGGGISSGSTLNLNNTIVAGNTATAAGQDLYNNGGSVNVTGVNLLSTLTDSGLTAGAKVLVGSPDLAALGNYGGPTQTMPPLPASPAIDPAGGDASSSLSTDQRGYARVANGTVDIGAVEVNLVVTEPEDSVAGSLRNIFLGASPGATITFDASLSGQSVSITNGQLAIGKNIVLDGSTLADGITLNAHGENRHFQLNSGTTNSFIALTLINGNSAGSGGAILVNFGAKLTVSRSSLTGNSASSNGGGIYNGFGTLTVQNTTLSGNSAAEEGGGIYHDGGTLTVKNSTLSGNSALRGGGIRRFAGTLNLNNTIVANNTASSGIGPDLYRGSASVTPTGVNLFSDLSDSDLTASATVVVGSPMLAPLGHYGGPTQTMPPLPGSPAIDPAGGDVSSSLSIDQRGYARVVDGTVDIGAVEVQSTVVTAQEDSVTGSLREVFLQSSPGATITFTNTLSGQTILLTNGQITLNKSVTIDASALPAGIAINANANSRIFQVNKGSMVVLDSLTITNGSVEGIGAGICNFGNLTVNRCTIAGNSATGVAGYGGGIYNDFGTLTVQNSTLSGNAASEGGAVYNYTANIVVGVGSFTGLNQCTLANNTASASGGAVRNSKGWTFMTNCTVTLNSAQAGGGVWTRASTATETVVANTIIAGNTATTGPDLIDEGGTVNATGVNLFSTLAGSGLTAGAKVLVGSPDLAALGNYGGPTLTLPPLPGSLAIDAGDNATASGFADDQRGPGFPRLSGDHVDIGAAELQLILSSTPVEIIDLMSLGDGTFQFSFTNDIGASFRVLATTNVALPVTNWSFVGFAIETPPGSGQFQFTDSDATNDNQRFYSVKSP